MTARRSLVRVTNPLGMHARAAARFARLASRFSARVTVEHDWRTVDGKSILGLLLLGAACGTEIAIVADGEDADAAVEALCRLVEASFEEGEADLAARPQ